MPENKHPKAVFLDGPSASGKSSFKNMLLRTSGLNLEYVKRLTTRSPRFDDADNEDYEFVSAVEFNHLIKNNALIEYRHFDFGMSYGILRSEIERVHEAGKNSLALMNLGTIDMVRSNYKGAVCLMVICPLEHIERRLRDRHHHTDAQIDERLRNAAAAFSHSQNYDYVIDNFDSNFENALSDTILFLRGLLA